MRLFLCDQATAVDYVTLLPGSCSSHPLGHLPQQWYRTQGFASLCCLLAASPCHSVFSSAELIFVVGLSSGVFSLPLFLLSSSEVLFKGTLYSGKSTWAAPPPSLRLSEPFEATSHLHFVVSIVFPVKVGRDDNQFKRRMFPFESDTRTTVENIPKGRTSQPRDDLLLLWYFFRRPLKRYEPWSVFLATLSHPPLTQPVESAFPNQQSEAVTWGSSPTPAELKVLQLTFMSSTCLPAF
jgi:hypothetical protein